MTQSVESKVISKIYGKGRGWVFSRNDFAPLGGLSALRIALVRLKQKGIIRRVIRGLYDYPEHSSLLEQNLSPDLYQVARALARKFAWRIQPSGEVALNLLGLSTQVPAKYIYKSNGPKRSYQIGKTTLEFRSATLKDTFFEYPESNLIVQAFRSLGKERINSDIAKKVRQSLDPSLYSKILKDTQGSTGWIYEAIKKVCQEKPNE